MRQVFNVLLTALALVGASSSALVHAQPAPYPNKPIRVIFPYPPGSNLDAVGRSISDRLGKELGQPVIFDNRPGANGILGTSVAARAAPDGYTLELTTTSAFLLNSYLRKDLPYDPLKSFTPVVAFADIPVALMVSSRVPANTFTEFLAYARKNPGKLNYGSVGNGSFNHLYTEQFKQVAQVDMLHVPYQGAGPLAIELMAGRVEASVLGIGSVLDQWKSGQMKALVFMSPKRIPGHPDIPAITEEFPKVALFSNWIGFVAPAGTPPAIVNRLNAAISAVVRTPEMRKLIEQQQWLVLDGSAQEFQSLIERDIPAIESAVKAAGVKPE